MGFGDLVQKWVLGKSLGASGVLNAFPNHQSHLFFFNLHFFNFLIFTTNINWTHYI